MQNNLSFTVSVQQNSNKIISSSNDNFAGISNGDLIKITDDNNLYTIIGKENFFYIKNFDIRDSRTIILDHNIGINLQKGDNIKISYKEYELLMVLDILEGGQGYTNDDELTVCGGSPYLDISNGISQPAKLKIMEIASENGAIKQVGIKEQGIYLDYPPNPVSVISADGTGAKFELRFNEREKRNILEREIVNINFKDEKTLITLNYALPVGLKQGKFSTSKNYLILDKNYIGKTQSNLNYQIFRDFTPNIRIPLMATNTISFSTIFNKAMGRVDSEITTLKEEIKKLKTK